MAGFGGCLGAHRWDRMTLARRSGERLRPAAAASAAARRRSRARAPRPSRTRRRRAPPTGCRRACRRSRRRRASDAEERRPVGRLALLAELLARGSIARPRVAASGSSVWTQRRYGLETMRAGRVRRRAGRRAPAPAGARARRAAAGGRRRASCSLLAGPARGGSGRCSSAISRRRESTKFRAAK